MKQDSLTSGARRDAPDHCESYRHSTYLTSRGLVATLLLAAMLPAAMVVFAAPHVVGATLLGASVGALGIATRNANQ